MLFSEPKIPQCCSICSAASAVCCVSVLFSEPKIPQWRRLRHRVAREQVSVLFSEPKIPQSLTVADYEFSTFDEFQCSSASRKFLNGYGFPLLRSPAPVSVLFSEPKIPQYKRAGGWLVRDGRRFSALQRAENSSMFDRLAFPDGDRRGFSALQRAENSSIQRAPQQRPRRVGFSALQRAENSSIVFGDDVPTRTEKFQCSSASRKFLNRTRLTRFSFPALVSVLFSEPKIPQSLLPTLIELATVGFSALQRAENSSMVANCIACCTAASGFSALQRAENSSITVDRTASHAVCAEFQCSSASRKFLNSAIRPSAPFRNYPFQCSSASRKFLNSAPSSDTSHRAARFQCSSASRKFLNHPLPHNTRVQFAFQCSSASRKFLNATSVAFLARINDPFQCSSASRKFLNLEQPTQRRKYGLFQCSSASRKFLNRSKRRGAVCVDGEFQCSSASRKFLNRRADRADALLELRVSVLFSEPKIPQCTRVRSPRRGASRFQCSSASRKFLNLIGSRAPRRPSACAFQCSSASRKFLNSRLRATHAPTPTAVSVLFSEPKIPQCSSLTPHRQRGCAFQCSSASRKFLNRLRTDAQSSRYWFQCSSASRKFLNPLPAAYTELVLCRFSALQRAENSSIGIGCVEDAGSPRFQCSSASRKFLNSVRLTPQRRRPLRAFQCSSASRKFLNQNTNRNHTEHTAVSVLFSEPKIPQWDRPR